MLLTTFLHWWPRSMYWVSSSTSLDKSNVRNCFTVNAPWMKRRSTTGFVAMGASTNAPIPKSTAVSFRLWPSTIPNAGRLPKTINAASQYWSRRCCVAAWNFARRRENTRGYDHVNHADENFLSMMDLKVHGERSKGRPKQQWFNTLDGYWRMSPPRFRGPCYIHPR